MKYDGHFVGALKQQNFVDSDEESFVVASSMAFRMLFSHVLNGVLLLRHAKTCYPIRYTINYIYIYYMLCMMNMIIQLYL